MLQVAVYGKGGIGKSTISSNLSYLLAKKGKKVVHIGCDPKHDSTKFILHEGSQKTVLDYLKDVPVQQANLSEIAVVGKEGILCIETGGPEPGIGCAGRGVLTSFDALKRLGLEDEKFDLKVYDVLGDVVCGGFAVPLRREYSDAVYLVTSGEFMSIYAANNIMRGMLNFDPSIPRIAGLILNKRGLENEEDFVRRFSEATGVPIVATIPRSKEFPISDKMGKLVSEAFPESEPAIAISLVRDNVLAHIEGTGKLYKARPLGDRQLDELMTGRKITAEFLEETDAINVRTTNSASMSCLRVKNAPAAPKGRTDSCASRGAAFVASKVKDVAIVVHGPSNCGYVMAHTSDYHYLTDVRSNRYADVLASNNVSCTRMDDTSAIFGGVSLLEKELRKKISEGFTKIFVVTTCVPGMIGDDSQEVVARISEEFPGITIDLVEVDGNITGDTQVGQEAVTSKLIDMIDPDVEPGNDTVNLICAVFIAFNTTANERNVIKLLSEFGLSINCKFLDICDTDDIINMKSAYTSVLVEESEINFGIASKLFDKGMDVFPMALPKGKEETLLWAEEMAARRGCPEKLASFVARVENEYSLAVGKYGKNLRGKKVAISLRSARRPDWIADALEDAGAEILQITFVKTGGNYERLNSAYQKSSRPVVECNIKDSVAELMKLNPDLVICDYGLPFSKYKTAILPWSDISYDSSIELLKIASNALKTPPMQGWKKDLMI
ncbi:MAG: AAA family ATPase [Candidatus Methanomethylophilaceae archaeon]|nr:AAA family ATPase [Candidatus Methanomethylophilaceae archaeon]